MGRPEALPKSGQHSASNGPQTRKVGRRLCQNSLFGPRGIKDQPASTNGHDNSTISSSQNNNDYGAPMPSDYNESACGQITSTATAIIESHSTAVNKLPHSTTLCNKWIASQHPDTCFTPMMPQGLCTITCLLASCTQD